MHLPEWLILALRIFVLIALIPSGVHAFRQVKGRIARALLTGFALLLIGGFVVLISLP